MNEQGNLAMIRPKELAELRRRAALYDEMVAALLRARSCIDGMSLPHGYGPQQFILPEIDSVLKKAGAL